MSTYNSVQDGPWNDSNTWSEAGWPNANDDVINFTHKIAYNLGVSSLQFGNITGSGNGRLEVPVNVNSVLGFNSTGALILNSGAGFGGVNDGIIDALKYFQLKWPQGVSERNVLVVNDGAIFNLKGDSNYYGGVKYATLKSVWDANATLTFYVVGDLSSAWKTGQKIWLYKYVLYGNYQSDGEIFEIDTVGSYDSGNNRTPITVINKGAGATFAISAPIIMLSRNVDICDPNTPWSVYGHSSYAERLKFDNNQGFGNSLIDLSDIMIRGFRYGIQGGYNTILNNGIFVNNHTGISGGTNNVINADFVTNGYGHELGVRNDFTGKFVSNTFGINTGRGCTVNGDIISNSVGIRDGVSNLIIGNFIGNYRGISTTSGRGRGGHKVEGNFYYNDLGIGNAKVEVFGNIYNNNTGIKNSFGSIIHGDFYNNTKDFEDDCTEVKVSGNFPTGITINMDSREIKRSVVLEEATISGIRRPIRVYGNSGIIVPLISTDGEWQTPMSDNNVIFKIVPNSYCNNNWICQLELAPLGELYQYFPAGTNVILYKIYPVNWSTPLTQDDILIEARYIPDGGVTRVKAVTSVGEFENGDWRNLSVTFNAGQSQLVAFQIILRKYESGAYVLIDPIADFV